MRKILKLLSTSLILVNSSTVLVACRPPTLGEIWIVTDGGDLFDKAFNQQVLEGSRDFNEVFNANLDKISELAGFQQYKNHPLKIRWIISKDGDISTLQNNYNIASYAGAKAIICAGFHHIPALTNEIQSTYKKLGVKFILIDSLVSNPVNLAGITYSAEKSSYLAGLAGAIWLVANHEQYETDGLKMSTFGAMPTDVIIENMMGYFWGVYYFNNNKDNNILAMINQFRASKNLPEMTMEQLNNFNVTFDKLDNSFTGGFESGTSAARTITQNLINTRKNDIVFPVAGAQTTDLISTIVASTNNNQARIVGVDVDQSEQYPDAKDYFLTSAKKGIRESVDWMLWNAFGLTKNGDDFTPNPEAEDYFNGSIDFSPLKDKQYVGIFDNPAISSFYQKLIETDDTYWNLADRVYDAFTNLSNDLANNSNPDKWATAWKRDVSENPSNPNYIPKF